MRASSGAKVSNTIRKGIVSVELFQTIDNGHVLLMAGQVAALGGRSMKIVFFHYIIFFWISKVINYI